jgi:mRNA-degrading endonuclease YafQ of YafQ-DinJ toxin-antitoxin module
MFAAEFSKYFQKQYKKLIKNNKIIEARIDTALIKLLEDPELVSHKVGEYWSYRVTGDIRIIWEYKDGELVLLLLKIGGHGQVYK